MSDLEERLKLIAKIQNDLSAASKNSDYSSGELLAMVALSCCLTLDARISKLEEKAGIALPGLKILEGVNLEG